MKKTLLYLLSCGLIINGAYADDKTLDFQNQSKISIVGGGIIGALESYYAYQDAHNKNEKIGITIYEKGSELGTTNTAYNIAASLTPDEILSVVPRGKDLVEKLAILFSQPGGIRVDDVDGANDSAAAIKFKEAVAIYGSDKNHDDRTVALLMLGKKSMELWQQLYDEGDEDFKAILEASNFNPCREPRNADSALHDGYRVDLIYGMENAEKRAQAMQADYEKLGYKQCKVLTPDEVVALDPFLADFCTDHSEVDAKMVRVWKNNCTALWRPGGCFDARVFLPRFYAYMKKVMGQYEDENGQLQDCFQLQFGKEVVGIELDAHSKDLRINGLNFSDGTVQFDADSNYIFCPGEAVGTLHQLGFSEPTYASFAGASLLISIPLSPEQIEQYKPFSHCMEVHNEGIVLAWQARFKENHIFIGVAGTKSFYGDKQPNKEEAFARNRNLVQLNMINDVLPEFLSIAYGLDTRGKDLSVEDLSWLEKSGIAKRWVGRRAVAYDGFPTLGSVYYSNSKVANARCTTQLGSGGVSFGPGAVYMSRCSEQHTNDAFTRKVLKYADSRRSAE